eukprot:gene24936-biopygen19362
MRAPSTSPTPSTPHSPRHYNNQLVPGTVSRFWSCWTYTIDLKQTCNPENSGHWVQAQTPPETGCRPHGNKGGPLTLDLAQPSTPNLYVHLSFSIVRMDLNELDSSYGYQCGQPQGYATVGLPGSGIIDLYNLPTPPTTLIYSNFYFNTSGRSFDRAQDCEVIDRLMAVYLRGRSYVRIACDVTSASGRWSVLYNNLRFTSTADRDFLFYTITTAYFWNDMLYPNLQPGCGFFGTYSQTDDNLVFKDPNFATPPSVPPFQNNIDTANPYFTVCTAYIAPNTSIPASSLSSYPPGIFGWAPPQQPAGIDPFTLDPFNVNTDPKRVIQNLNLLYSSPDVRPAYSFTSLFQETGNPTPSLVQALALVFSPEDMQAFIRAFTGSTNTLKVMASGFYLQCTDYVKPELLVALCTDFQDGAIITATFISIDAAQAMYRFLYIPGNTIIITTYILTAEIPPSTPSATFNRYQLYVKTPIYDSVSAANIKTYECPPLRDALSDVLIRRGVSLQTAYPPSSESENGCSIITATNEYVYYKVFFTLEESTWAFLKSSIGLANNQFIATARIMCSSEVSFALDNGVVELTSSGQNLYGLQQRAPMCKLDVLLP